MDITLFLTHCLLNAHLGHLYWMQYVLIVGILIATASCTILAYALGTNVSNVPGTHAVHPTTIQIERAVHVEDTPSIDRAGDAEFNSRLMIDNDYMDSTNSCEFCNKIEYTPGAVGKAGIAYRNDKLDLEGNQRIVFFARGQQGGEEVSFVAIGKSTSGQTTNDGDLFPNGDFAITTKNVTLQNDWKRYEISLNKTKLEDVTLPFGFVITDNESPKQIFYLKGVTFDRKLAQNPLPTVDTKISNATNK